MSKEQNYFYCLAKQEPCDRDMFGLVACENCETNGKCQVCGRHQTTFCEKCIHMASMNDKVLVTSE